MKQIARTQIANQVPYDNTVSGLTAIDVQAAIDEIKFNASIAAAPGFSWGRSGTLPANTYLLNDTVPSNISGRPVPLNNGVITTAFMTQENAVIFSFKIQKRTGVSFVDLSTITTSLQRAETFTSLNISVALNDEIAIKIVSGNPKNVDVGLIIKGTL